MTITMNLNNRSMKLRKILLTLIFKQNEFMKVGGFNV